MEDWKQELNRTLAHERSRHQSQEHEAVRKEAAVENNKAAAMKWLQEQVEPTFQELEAQLVEDGFVVERTQQPDDFGQTLLLQSGPDRELEYTIRVEKTPQEITRYKELRFVTPGGT